MSKGLRPSKRLPSNNSMMVECKGAVGRDGSLSSIPQITRNSLFDDALVVQGDFPFPQILISDNLIVVCNRTSLLEYKSGSLSLKFDASDYSGGRWSWSASGGYAYLSNGVVSVERDPLTELYSISTKLPKAMAICNYNGQTIIGHFVE